MLDFLRAVGDLRIEVLRITLGDPNVSDICEIGRVMVFRWVMDLGEVYELPRLLDRAIGVRWLPRNEKDSKKGDRGDLGDRIGGVGAGRGLTNLSGSSATSSSPGLKGGVIG